MAEATRRLKAMKMGASPHEEDQATLTVGDESDDVGVIYIYNCVPGLRHDDICQPPNFPRFHVPICKPGEKVGYTTIRALIKNRFNRPGTDEHYYINEDGRKQANSLLNPSVHPASPWETQLREIAPGTPGNAQDQDFNSNLNAFGVWWSETTPNDPALDGEIESFKKRFENTCRSLIANAEAKAVMSPPQPISPREHFAMDYLGLEARWHQTTARMTTCPNCGDRIRESIAYHKNFANDVCIVDAEKYYKLFPDKAPKNLTVEEGDLETAPARRGRPPKAQPSA